MMTHLINRAKLAQFVSFTHHPKFSLLRFSTITTTQCGGEPSPETKHLRVELPKELSKNMIKLSCESTSKDGVCDVYVVGTLHISKESSKQVEEIVKFLKPEIVFLELCSSRQNVLFHETMEVPTAKEMFAEWKKERKFFEIFYCWFLAKCGRERGVYPGAEFRSGYREAEKYGSKVVLGDRPLEITSKRTWRKLPLWHILRMFTPSTVFLKEREDIYRTELEETMSKTLPTVMETLCHERDQYMSYTLLKVASESRTVVAVVGRGHLEGIKNNWKQPVNIKDLETIPPPKPIVDAIFTYVGVIVAGLAIISISYL